MKAVTLLEELTFYKWITWGYCGASNHIQHFPWAYCGASNLIQHSSRAHCEGNHSTWDYCGETPQLPKVKRVRWTPQQSNFVKAKFAKDISAKTTPELKNCNIVPGKTKKKQGQGKRRICNYNWDLQLFSVPVDYKCISHCGPVW